MQTTNRWPWRAIILLILMILLIRPAGGMELSLSERLALERDPALLAFSQRIAAQEARAIAEGALPDPELLVGAQGVPVDHPLGADMMTQYRIGIRQRFPAGDSLHLREQAGEHQADALRASLRARRLEVLEQTRSAWIDWAAALQSLEIALASRQAFEDLLAITQARYRAGTGRQRDINQARLELALLEQRILERRTAVDDAESRLERWTGLAPARGFDPDLPDWARPVDRSLLEEKLSAHPSLRVLEQQVAAGAVQVELAEAAYQPQWMLEAGYGHTRGNNPTTLQRQSDKLFAMVTFSVPLFTANRQDRRLAAARAEMQARGHDIDHRLQELRGELDRHWRSWHRHEERLRLLEQRVLVEAENAVDATLASYRADQASFDELIRARLALLEQKLVAIELRRARLQAAVELRYLAGESR
ncbi:MAG: TolC family protein [Gammaproteobacteria bacterium]|jgi:outer membrane protein TolC|nr:TolC family protein [Gammaproteobacteria bacterium]